MYIEDLPARYSWFEAMPKHHVFLVYHASSLQAVAPDLRNIICRVSTIFFMNKSDLSK